MHRIVFLTREGCAGSPLMLERLRAALEKGDLNVALEIVDTTSLAEDDVRTGFGTPTVLVDREDLLGAESPGPRPPS